MRGRTISIYLPQADPRGVKECSITKSTVRALFIPRPSLKDTDLSSLERPGVYFLIAPQESKSSVYVGEAENIKKRIIQHQRKEDDDFEWGVLIAFTSAVEDELHKAHIKHLESFCCEKVLEAGKYALYNKNNPTKSTLTKSQEDFVLDFFDDLSILLATLGHPVFEKTKKKNLFFCSGPDAKATGVYEGEGFTILKGSVAKKEEAPSMSFGRQLRRQLQEQQILKEKNDQLIFTENYQCKSPSAAAAIVLARNANGWTEWKNKEGKTLNDIHRTT